MTAPFNLRPCLALCLLWLAAAVSAQTSSTAITATRGTHPNLAAAMDMPLRYRPDGGDFVIENGAEFFNRPLYGRNTAFRVDAGDKPEFSMYLPGRGGNLRLGVKGESGAKWLADAAKIVARYRPGSMLYEISDPLLGADGKIQLTALALHGTDGVIVRAEGTGLASGLELIWAYGGANGQRGSRDGDIGTERVPISEYFQLQPGFCADNVYTLAGSGFTMHSAAADIAGVFPDGSKIAVADAAQWRDIAALLGAAPATAPATPVAVGRVAFASGAPLFLSLQRTGGADATELDTYRDVTAPGGAAGVSADTATSPVRFAAPFKPAELPAVFARDEAIYKGLRERFSVDTPDPYINAAVGALGLAADGIWDDPQQVVMHGAIAWRSRLLGWRGPYAMDAQGWHDRARAHLTYWASRQNTKPIPEKLPPPDEDSNFARSEAALHSNGDMSNSHYDMNTVYIDALFRHLLWTGDLEFAKQMWPVIERHLAWERRLFRREYGPDKLPLYEAYAVIWASDDLQYNGGGTTHSSAYQHYHNKMAARVAELIGKDPAPYEKEADLIAQGMRKYLWLEDKGAFAEYRDYLGNQLAHPSAALWTYYHTLDSEVPTPQEALAMTKSLDRDFVRIPVKGPGVPDDAQYHMLPSTDWMPYSWSINNVTMGENIHTALAYWQAGRPEDAFLLTKSSLLASMFMGICPGNVGTMNYLDVYRRESQRDFGDGNGVTSRAIVEGLFGIKPNALAGELIIEPGFPASWDHAKLNHPDFMIDIRRNPVPKPSLELWTVTLAVGSPFRVVKLRLPAGPARDIELNVRFNSRQGARALGRGGRIEENKAMEYSFGDLAGAPKEWMKNEAPEPVLIARASSPDPRPNGLALSGYPNRWSNPHPNAVFEPVPLDSAFNDRVTNIYERGKYRSPRSPFVSLAVPAQGIGAWAGAVNAFAQIDDSGLRRVAGENGGKLAMPNGVPFATAGPGEANNILFVSQYDNYPDDATVPLSGRAKHLYLLMAGSTYFMQSRIDNGEVVVEYTDGTSARLALENPTNWWPIEEDYFIDDFQFKRPGVIPPRINLRSGEIRLLDEQAFKGRGRNVNGGAATALELPLDPQKELKSLSVRSLANEVVIGLMSATLERP